MSFDIRPIEARDEKRVAEIIRTVLKEFNADRPGCAWEDPEVDAMHAAYALDDSVYLVVEIGGRVVGGAGIAPHECELPNTCELQKMYLLPEARGVGIGRLLLVELMQRAMEIGYHNCYLETLDRMDQAVRLYEQSGFHKMDGPLGSTGHTICEAWYLRRLV